MPLDAIRYPEARVRNAVMKLLTSSAAGSGKVNVHMSATVDDYPTVGRIGRVLARAAMVRCHHLPIAAQLLEDLEPELTGTSQAAHGQ